MMVSKSLSIANMLFADVSCGATIKEIYSRCLLLWGFLVPNLWFKQKGDIFKMSSGCQVQLE
jgi:hypothetical protein